MIYSRSSGDQKGLRFYGSVKFTTLSQQPAICVYPKPNDFIPHLRPILIIYFLGVYLLKGLSCSDHTTGILCEFQLSPTWAF